MHEINFLGETFLVPNPPAEYLATKYGPDWRIPKQAGEYETDVLATMSDTTVAGRAGRLKQSFARHLLWWRTATVRVLDEDGNPARGAEISLAGLGITRAGRRGVVRLYVPRVDHYSLVVRFNDHEGVLYVEKVQPSTSYVYRPGEEHLLVDDNHA